MRILLTGLVIALLSTPLLAQKFESEDLVSNTQHRSAKWFLECEAPSPNIYRMLAAMASDTSLSTDVSSIEHRRAISFIAKHWHEVDRSGNVAPPQIDLDGVQAFLLQSKKPTDVQADVTWRNVGPFGWDRDAQAATGSMGIGVVRCLGRHFQSSSTIFAGTISSGLWKSSSRGAAWKNVTDPLLVTTISDVVVAPSDTDFVYAATNIGLIRSVDGGETFEQTTLTDHLSYPNSKPSSHVAVDPTDSFILLASYDGALHRSTNGGVTWNRSEGSDGEYWDLEWHPQQSNIVYALKQSGRWVTYHRSIDGGRTFTPSGNGLPVERASGRILRGRLATSEAAPNRLWVLFGGIVDDTVGGVWGLYTSYDQGATFSHVCCGDVDGPEPASIENNPNLFDYNILGSGVGQLTWDMGFDVSSTDTTILVAAGIFPYISRDGGRTWNKTAPAHYDVQDISVIDTSIMVANDGGLGSVSLHDGSVTDLSRGICALEVWGLGQSHRSNVLAVGAYHMPIFIRDSAVYSTTGHDGGWYPWSGADAMSADVNPDAEKWIYAKPWSSVRGERSMDASVVPRDVPLGIDLGYIPLTNLAFHPHETYTILGADHSDKTIKRSRDNAGTWEPLFKFDTWVSRVRISQSNPDFYVVLGDGNLMLSTDGGTTWQDRSPGPEFTTTHNIVDVVVDERYKEGLWVAFSGIQSEVKVLHTQDGGRRWTRNERNLPSTRIRSMVALEGSNGVVLVGTDLGVYIRTDDTDEWAMYGSGLPATSAKFIHADYVNNVLRIGTNRGVWEAPLPRRNVPVARIARDRDTVWCDRTAVVFSDRSVAANTNTLSREWSFPGGFPAFSKEATVNVTYKYPGHYDATLVVHTDERSDTTTLERAVIVQPFQCNGVDDVPGLAIDLSGPADYVLLDPIADTLRAFTFMAWVKPNGYQPNFSAIFCSDELGNVNEIGMQFTGDSNHVGYLWSGGQWWWDSGLRLEPDVWSHVAMTADSTGATVYVNGVSERNTTPLAPIDATQMLFTLGTYHFWNSRNADIQADEVRMYSRALSTTEIRLNMHHPADPDDDLIALYQFNEPEGAPTFNRAGRGQGELHNGASKRISLIPFGPGSSALAESPTDGWVEFPLTYVTIDIDADLEADMMVSRIDILPNNTSRNTHILGPSYWVVHTFGQTPTIMSNIMSNIRLSVENLISKDEVSDRSFFLDARDVNSSADWNRNIVLGGFEPSYDDVTQNVRYWTKPTPANLQFHTSVNGPTVSVTETPAPFIETNCTLTDHEPAIIYNVIGEQVAVVEVVNNTVAPFQLSSLPQQTLWAVQGECARRVR